MRVLACVLHLSILAGAESRVSRATPGHERCCTRMLPLSAAAPDRRQTERLLAPPPQLSSEQRSRRLLARQAVQRADTERTPNGGRGANAVEAAAGRRRGLCSSSSQVPSSLCQALCDGVAAPPSPRWR